MGLLNLPHISEIIAGRKKVCEWYDELLGGADVTRPLIPDETLYNYIYYPVLFPSETALIKAKEQMNAHNIFPRRYFYPSLNHLPYITKSDFPITDQVAPRVLCLPLYPDLAREQVESIVKFIQNKD